MHRSTHMLRYILLLLIGMLFMSGCSNESDKLYCDSMERGKASQSNGEYKEAAEAFFSAAKIRNAHDAERKFKEAVKEFCISCANPNQTGSSEILAQFNSWISSEPTPRLESLFYRMDVKNPTMTEIRRVVIQTLRKRLGTTNWKEKLSLELKIIGIKVSSIEISSLAIQGESLKTMNIWRDRPDIMSPLTQQQTQDVIDVLLIILKDPAVPNVDSVRYAISNDQGLSLVEICKVTK